jgi:hypothetical protein
MVGFIFHKFVRNFTRICEKILQICVKLGKSCLVGLRSRSVPDRGQCHAHKFDSFKTWTFQHKINVAFKSANFFRQKIS